MKKLTQTFEEILNNYRVETYLLGMKKSKKLNELFGNEIVNDLIRAVKERDKEVLGEDESEVQDFSRQLYFVGKNDCRAEIKQKMEETL